MKLYIYSGAGNSFVVLDARKPLEVDIQGLCSRFGTDGLMMLSTMPSWISEWSTIIPTEAAV